MARRWRWFAGKLGFPAIADTRLSIDTRTSVWLDCRIEVVGRYEYENRFPFQAEKAIVRLKQDHPTRDARKIREMPIRNLPVIKPPARSTAHAALDRNGPVKHR